MMSLAQFPDGSGGGPAVYDEEQSSSPDPGASTPSQMSDQTSETSPEVSDDEKLATVFPNGRYDPGISCMPNPGQSLTSTSLTNAPISNISIQSSHIKVSQGRDGQHGQGSGRLHSVNPILRQGARRRGLRNRPVHHSDTRSGMTPARLMATLTADWSNFRNVLITLIRVPDDVTTWDLYLAFQSLGNIVYVDIEEDAKSQRTGVAKIRFEPPPRDPLLPGHRVVVSVQSRRESVLVFDVTPWWRESRIRSPLNNWVPSKVVLKLATLTFGIMVERNTFMQMRSVGYLDNNDEQLNITVDFRRRKLEINFSVLFQDMDRPDLPVSYASFKLEGKFEAISKVHRVCNADTKSVVISFEYPPRFFRKKLDVQRTHDAGRLQWGDNDLWARLTEITHGFWQPSQVPACLENRYQYIDIGRWTTYQIELDPVAQSQWKHIEDSWVDWNIKTVHEDAMQFVPKTEARLWSMVESVASEGKGLVFLDFDVRYQLEVCISHGIIHEHNITRDFLLKLQELSGRKVQNQNRARLVLEYAADQKKRLFDPMSLFSDDGAMTFYPPCTHIPAHCALVRKVTVTPTRIYFHTPTLETTNRVIRHHSKLQDNFLRVSFTDELNDGRINGCDTVRDNELYTRAFRVMNNGIRMGRWHWQFLAFGNSQIRENGAFFFCEEDGVTCESIRNWMGRFTHIKVVAKYAARLGQCFSTTRLLGNLPSPTIVTIPDVERNGYCFTDGIGKLSTRLAKMIADEWKEDTVPSGFQFRMGGCKGVLVAWPDVKDLEVHIRKSQKKFSSEFNGLEIIRLSHYTTATLNRQIICILSSLGVPDSVFMSLLRQQVRDYDYAMKDRAFACKLLRQNVDESQSSVMIANMLDYGFMEAKEPYVHAMLQLWKSWSLKYLKEKARIPIADSAFVLGCIDETGTLKGHINKKRRRDDKLVNDLPEIFLQISDPNNRGDAEIITGVCIVGRNPSLHPGDIRVVMAVDVPALHHVRDLVVFPLQGDRDIPSMCSGGDLDGDDFFVIWNRDLIPNEWTHPPLHFEPAVGQELDRVPAVKDLQKFFAMYMQNNSLPIIAHAHLAQADFRDSGAKDPRCVELAKLHSKAVDYVKTGVPAVMDKKLDPRKYPHFMEKRNSYHSEKILGQMYDAVHRVQFHPHYEMPFDPRILKRYDIAPEVLKKARNIKTQYDTALKRIMGQLEIRTEFEALSAFIMSKPRVGTQYKMHETVRRETDALRQQFKDACIEAAGGSREFKVLAPFVAAMYQVTREEVQIALYESRTPHINKHGRQGLRQIKPESMPLISFPWLFDGILGRIATTSSDGSSQGEKMASETTVLTSSESNEAAFLDTEFLQHMEYRRTDAGVFHRGQFIRLFNHDEEDDEAVMDPGSEPEQPSQKVDDFIQPELLMQVDEDHEKQPVVEMTLELIPGQKLPDLGGPTFRNTITPLNEQNYGDCSDNQTIVGFPQAFHHPPQTPDGASDESTEACNHTDKTPTQSDETAYTSLDGNGLLIDVDIQRTSAPDTLNDIEATLPRFVDKHEPEQDHAFKTKPADDSRRRKLSSCTNTKRMGSISLSEETDTVIAKDKMSKTKERQEKDEVKQTEQILAKEEEDEDDLEIEEVILERKPTAFDVLKKFATTDNTREQEGEAGDVKTDEVKKATTFDALKRFAEIGHNEKKHDVNAGQDKKDMKGGRGEKDTTRGKQGAYDPFAGLMKLAKR